MNFAENIKQWVSSDNRIKNGDLVLIEALGGGMTWGSGLMRW